MILVTSVDNMRQSDLYTIDNHTSGKELMKKAAQGIFNAVKWYGKIAVVCGGGNNAGDGYALASILKSKNQNVSVFRLSDKLTSDGSFYFQKCKGLDVKIISFDEKTNFDKYDIIVDCIFGTGFKGQARELAKTAIEKINESSSYVVSADINSGLNGDSGLGNTVVKSQLTVSIGNYKSGHFLNMAKDVMNDKTNIDIGVKLQQEPFHLLQDKDFKTIFPKRKNHSHKTTYGVAAILGGSIKYSGAIKLANQSLSALRAGCGLCKLIIPHSINHSIMPYILESTLEPVTDENGQMLFKKEIIDNALKGVTSLAIGMGWGKSKENIKILDYILKNYEMPIVIDADGINALCHLNFDILKQTKCKVTLTPHMGEFSRLINKSVEEINSDPITFASHFSKEFKVTLLLKGPCAIIADNKNVYLVDKGVPGMATGGSGDVLSGIICGINAFSAQRGILNAACGAHINGVAGELAQKLNNEYSMLASDTVKQISKAISKIINS